MNSECINRAEIAFDLDGTLITCRNRQMAILRAVALSLGKDLDVERVWNFKRDGMNTEQSLRCIGWNEGLAKEAHLRWMEIVEQPAWLSLDTVFNDTFEVLQHAIKLNFKLHLITARKSSHWLFAELQNLLLSNYFSKVSVVPPQSSTKSKTKILQQHKPLVFFGDTESDYKASAMADISFYAVTTGQRSAGFLTTHSIRNFQSLHEAWNSFFAHIFMHA